MYAGPQVGVGSPISEKSIWWVWYGHIYIQIHIYIYIYDIYMCGLDYTLDVWCFPASLPIGGSVAGKGGVAHIAAHGSPTKLREVALPETVL